MAKGLFDLSGKVAVVTGGNSGLGLGFARGIAKQGGDVVIWGRSADKNAAAKKELETFGVRVQARQVDVSAEEQVLAGYEALMKEFGRLDCVIANAGLPPPRSSSILELSTEDYHAFLDVSGPGRQGSLRRGKGGYRRDDPLDGRRIRQIRHSRELHRSRLHQDRHDRGELGAQSGGQVLRLPDPDSAAGLYGGFRGGRRVSGKRCLFVP